MCHYYSEHYVHHKNVGDVLVITSSLYAVRYLMASPHSADSCSNGQCFLPNCINWKANKLLDDFARQSSPEKRNRSCTRLSNGRTCPEMANRGSPTNEILKRRAPLEPKFTKAANSPRTAFSSPVGANAPSLQPVVQAQGAHMGSGNSPNVSMALDSQMPTTSPNAYQASWISLGTLDAGAVPMGTCLPAVPEAPTPGVPVPDCLFEPFVPATSQSTGLPGGAVLQDDLAVLLGLASATSPSSPLSSPGSNVLIASTDTNPALSQSAALPTRQQTGVSNPGSVTVVSGALPNNPAITSHVDFSQTPLAPAYPPMPAQYRHEPNEQFSRVVLSCIRRVIMTLEQPRVNQERVICILEEAVSKLERTTTLL